ncbi:ribose 1,5-bisphosphate isomerase [candidate division WOR-3 bacterium JGI_Cruoil_03_51_56]|uniref:Thiamine thiazole synthase n=1 Tax=candidate division WOR-3 bacterium JGI_Cruoil_03_51_56 TaxID=1973747 RepID=A0A235BUL3_UNCW3|nr:MAG: ribose 1,5-bisphosphate isomerase [candidate division WOR-3 bacterium JGI_Cruoil_03_51_56]
MPLSEIEISRVIIERYTKRFLDNLETDVAVVGAGPSGLTAAYTLAEKGLKTVVFERALKPGGGLPGGGMMFSEIVVQKQAVPVLKDLGIRLHEQRPGYFVADAIETLGALLVRATRAGVKIFNLVTVEDILLVENRVSGLVLNWSTVPMTKLSVDPLTMKTAAVLDATGHPAEIVNGLVRKAGVKLATPSGGFEGEGPMWADEAERLILEHAVEVFPGLWVSGMAANAVFGGPRMGPIFGGMFLSGIKAAEGIAAALKSKISNPKNDTRAKTSH